MDAKSYNDGLADLRKLRDEIKPLERQLRKLQADRDKKIAALGAYEKAKADRLATSAGLSVIDVVALVPRLGPQALAGKPAAVDVATESAGDRSGAEAGVQTLLVGRGVVLVGDGDQGHDLLSAPHCQP
ncbi:hypothetical protein AB0478_44805 [Streptomyces sp. NPDC051917]|uniref:hypothetical protein n=1 Tax=Streptomyces sp. NPDC051917 TaxID=3154754 RepID=UPI0034528FB0